MDSAYMPVRQTTVWDIIVNSNIEEEEDVDLKKQINCKQCVKIFKSIPLLRTHVTKMHTQTKIVDALKTRIFTERASSKGVPCSFWFCKKSYTSIKSMRDHVKCEHKGEKIVCGEKKLDGSLCMLSFTRVGVHRKTHDKSLKYKCDSCDDKSYSSMATLNRHKNNKHVLKTQCGYCPKEFASKGNLNAHIENVHNGFETL